MVIDIKQKFNVALCGYLPVMKIANSNRKIQQTKRIS